MKRKEKKEKKKGQSLVGKRLIFLTAVLLPLPLFLFSIAIAFGHEGHDHDTPRMIQAPKGGVIKSLEETHVEVVSKGKDVRIYFYDKELKPRPAAEFKVSAVAELPRTKKTEVVKLTAKENFFEGSYDAKGIHRYTLIVTIVDPKTGHPDQLSFTIEPRR